MNMEYLKQTLEYEEGRVPHAYLDHLGNWTIGVGHMVDERKGGGLPDHIIDLLLEHDIKESTDDLIRNVTNWAVLPDNVRDALVLMRFQLGITGLLGFMKMMDAIDLGDYKTAADEALDSKWARDDTPDRAQSVAALMRGE